MHAAIAPEHRDWWASAAFFAALAVFQVGWAALVLLRSAPRRILLLGAVVNAGALTTWAVSRTTGMPFGPNKGEAEPLARADALASVLGAAAIVGAIGVLRGWSPITRLSPLRPLAATSAGCVLVSAMSLVALTGVSGHAHPAGGDHAEHGGSAPGGVRPAAASTAIEHREVASSAVRCANQAKVAAAVARKLQARPSAKAKAAVRKQEKRLLAACESPVAPTRPAAEKAVVADAPHDDSDGHSH